MENKTHLFNILKTLLSCGLLGFAVVTYFVATCYLLYCFVWFGKAIFPFIISDVTLTGTPPQLIVSDPFPYIFRLIYFFRSYSSNHVCLRFCVPQVLKKATIRKEQEPDFEEKRFNVTIGEDEREFDKENDFFRERSYRIIREYDLLPFNTLCII